MSQAICAYTPARPKAEGAIPSISTEMRDTARLVNGRVVFDRSVIFARAWKIARREHAGYAAIGAAARFPLVRCFAEALQLVILCAEAAERPTLRDIEDLAAARAELATLPAAA